MERFYGFDLGDAESAIARLHKGEQGTPEMLKLKDAASFVTAYALLADGTLEIGEAACYQARAVRRGLRFKSRFLTDPSSHGDIKALRRGFWGSWRQTATWWTRKTVVFTSAVRRDGTKISGSSTGKSLSGSDIRP